MKKYSKLFILTSLIMVVVTALSGCKKKQEEQPQPEPTQQETTKAPVQSSEIRSYTSGRKVDKNGYPIFVSIPNDGSARPHYNISKADIVYEMYVEGGITRMLALFNDNKPDKVGPVRSGRFYMVDIVDDWRAGFVHFGGPKASNEWSLYRRFYSARIKYRLDGTATSSHFSRDSSRKAPNNAFVNLQAYSATINNGAPTWHPMKFSETPTAGNTEVNEISINYSGSNKVKYKYNAEKGGYDRSVNNVDYVDAADNTQVNVQNIIIQETTQTNYGDVKGHINLDMIGSGKAYFHIGGKMIEGTWERPDRAQPTVYKDADGNEINLSVGQTFVQIVTSAVEVKNS